MVPRPEPEAPVRPHKKSLVCPKLLVILDHLGWFQNRLIVPAEAEKPGQVAKGSGPDAAHTLATAYLHNKQSQAWIFESGRASITLLSQGIPGEHKCSDAVTLDALVKERQRKPFQER